MKGEVWPLTWNTTFEWRRVDSVFGHVVYVWQSLALLSGLVICAPVKGGAHILKWTYFLSSSSKKRHLGSRTTMQLGRIQIAFLSTAGIGLILKVKYDGGSKPNSCKHCTFYLIFFLFTNVLYCQNYMSDSTQSDPSIVLIKKAYSHVVSVNKYDSLTR